MELLYHRPEYWTVELVTKEAWCVTKAYARYYLPTYYEAIVQAEGECVYDNVYLSLLAHFALIIS